ncbi:MAG: Mut7-C RNAse domain-containing protein [Candidatus Omnitrophica bacterium]|nr:Mut7-C RNAse domain-containing protein [Candidatus Omnitrophota bacterium]
MKFILTKELGRLARWLRILGFDALYQREGNQTKVLLLALREGRIVITRNKVLFDKISAKAVYLKEGKLKEQLKKTIKALNITIDEGKMFSRCVVCNKPLVAVDKTDIKDKVPPYVNKTQDEFSWCSQCQKAYWPGSHWGNIRRYFKELGP